jgi:hypothetical protein
VPEKKSEEVVCTNLGAPSSEFSPATRCRQSNASSPPHRTLHASTIFTNSLHRLIAHLASPHPILHNGRRSLNHTCALPRPTLSPIFTPPETNPRYRPNTPLAPRFISTRHRLRSRNTHTARKYVVSPPFTCHWGTTRSRTHCSLDCGSGFGRKATAGAAVE